LIPYGFLNERIIANALNDKAMSTDEHLMASAACPGTLTAIRGLRNMLDSRSRFRHNQNPCAEARHRVQGVAILDGGGTGRRSLHTQRTSVTGYTNSADDPADYLFRLKCAVGHPLRGHPNNNA
jgi:hypothetical protein